MSNDDLSLLNRASITYEYLHTNSTTHEFLFGAIAELVDNARDAQAKTMHIDYGSGQLSFLDDGCGMDKEEVISIVSFGHSTKRLDPNMVGQYGNGLKSGAMRIGKDFILFTKKEGLMTCMLLSRSFHEENNLKEVIVPTPSFLEDRRAYYDNKQQVQKHAVELDIVYQYSPFHSADELFSQFARITSDTGTLVVCYNLRRIEGGAYEMDFTTNIHDVRLTEHLQEREEEHNSLRTYLSVLYMNPRMRIFLRGEKVDTKRILSTLYKPRMYRYQAKNLKACAERELEKCQKKALELTDRVAQCKSEVANFEFVHPRYMTDPSLRVHYRTLVKALDDAEDMLATTDTRTKNLLKSKSNPSPLVFYFGLNIHHRDRYGCMVYNNGRLIRMYEKVAVQKEKNDSMMKYLGVVAVVDIPYSVLEPTHNKQSFENKREYMNVLKAVNDHMVQYWIDVAIGATPGGVGSFWKNFGYDSTAWDATASDKIEFVRKRLSSVGKSVQCDTCLKWRHLDFDPSFLTTGIPKDWRCMMHPNTLFRFCSKLEELPKIPEGHLTKCSEKPPVARAVKGRQFQPKRKAETAGPPRTEMRKHSPSPPARLSRPMRQSTRQTSYREESESDYESDESPLERSRAKIRARVSKAKLAEATAGKREANMPSTSRSGSDTSSLRQMARTKALARKERNRELAARSAERERALKRVESVKEQVSSANGSGTHKPARKAREREVTPPGCRDLGTVRKVAECLADSPQMKRPKNTEAPVVNSSFDDEASAASGSESVLLASESPKPPSTSETLVTTSESDKVNKMDEVVRKLNSLITFFKPSTVEIKEIKDVQDAVDFDLQSYLNAYKAGLDELIAEQVRKQINERMESHVANVVKLIQWSCPEMAGSVTSGNVFEKLTELLTML